MKPIKETLSEKDIQTIKKRKQEMREGKVTGIPHDELIKRLRLHLEKK